MFFNSFSFLVFFLAIFCAYIFLPQRGQNRLLLVGSYFFYAAWDYRFCLLLLTTTVVDYTVGMRLHRMPRYRKQLLLTSVGINLTILGFFKYFNFFTESFTALLGSIGLTLHPFTLQIVLPVGISFYTFQSMSYVIDLYRKEIKPVTCFADYALYVAFFPQLVAGPIERAKHLLPQILSERNVSFKDIQLGCYFIFCGLFLKVFVADNIARLIDPVFADAGSQTGLQILLAGYGFAFQIYGDFAGYSYIAKGLGRIMGFDIMDNFNLPYFSQNPQEFWRRWHISLSTWLRDYLYIPLGGNRGSSLAIARNLMITMLLGGLWHGAKITFVLWGAIHGILLIASHLIGTQALRQPSMNRTIPTGVIRYLRILLFFHVIVITWYFFRAESAAGLIAIFEALLFNFTFSGSSELASRLAFYIVPLLIFQVVQYVSGDRLAIFKMPILVRTAFYMVTFYLIVIFGVNHAQDFIYFQF